MSDNSEKSPIRGKKEKKRQMSYHYSTSSSERRKRNRYPNPNPDPNSKYQPKIIYPPINIEEVRNIEKHIENLKKILKERYDNINKLVAQIHKINISKTLKTLKIQNDIVKKFNRVEKFIKEIIGLYNVSKLTMDGINISKKKIRLFKKNNPHIKV